MDQSTLRAAATAWRDADVDPETIAEVDDLLAREAWDELRERFAAPMEFGTAGLRGLIGAGPGRMNLLTVMQASAAVARQLLADVPDAATRGVVVARDARRNSDVFAKATAEVIAGHGLKVWWLPKAAPTPVGAFLGRYKGAAGVVIVTASHNPPEYNGYKVYGPSASQIVPPQDERIRVLRDQVDPAHVRELPRVDFTQGVREGLITLVTHAEFEAFFDEIGAQCLGTNPPPAQIAAVTTALHGVGHEWVAEALSRRGHRHLFPVLAQAAPDGRFPTVRFPNPEEKGALDLALELAREKFAEVILANDPDTDRLCVAVRDESKPAGYRVLTGNEVGLLLADWILVQGPIVRGADWPKKPLVACSLVSTMMLEPLATLRGAVYGEVLTGFKWIWDLALKRAPDETYVFGFEEALGYCVGPAVRDKDGVGAAQAVMDLAAFEKARGRTLLDRLDDIAHAIGASHTDQVTAVLPGIDGMARIKRVMAAWRAAPPAILEKGGISKRRDLSGPEADAIGMPRGDVLTWWLADGSRIIARPSGTEPKLKVYLETRDAIGPDGLEAARAIARARAAELAVGIRAAIDQVQ